MSNFLRCSPGGGSEARSACWVVLTADVGSSGLIVGGGMEICFDPLLGGMSKGCCWVGCRRCPVSIGFCRRVSCSSISCSCILIISCIIVCVSVSLLSPGSSALASCVKTCPEDSASESCCVFPRVVFLGFLIAVPVFLAVVAGGVTGSLLDDILAVQQISASRGRCDLENGFGKSGLP